MNQRLPPLTLLPVPVRWAARALPTASVGVILVLLAHGRFRGIAQPGWDEVAGMGLLLVAVAVAAARRAVRSRDGTEASLRDDLNLGGPLVCATYVVVALGGPSLAPLVYLLLACLVGFLHGAAAAGLLALAIGCEALLAIPEPGWTAVSLGTRAVFLALFVGFYRIVLNARLALARKAEQDAVRNRIRDAEEQARTFRLVSSGTSEAAGGEADREKWLLASVKEVEGAVGAALEIGSIALRTHTCAVFLLSTDDRTLQLYDGRSSSDLVERGPIPAGEGVLGGALKRGVAVRMASPGGLRGVTWYESAAPVKAVLAVPVVERTGHQRGVLVADRLDAEAFGPEDERLLGALAGEVLRALEVERVLATIRKTRDEKDRFFRAIGELNRAGNPEAVFGAVLESARQLAGLDFSAVTLVSEMEGKRQHRIARVSGVTTAGKALEGRSFEDNQGLVANVVRYGTPLPGRELRSMDRQVIFDADTQVRGLAALKIFPLTAGDRILGTLVAGSRRRAALDEDALRMLEVLALQAGQAVLRAQLFEETERLAATDGLTGLMNHRTFQARADELLAQARRYGRSCAVLLADVDHFKSVNDTYGHPAGDQVLQGVAQVLRETARDTDVVARYGGEEFAVVMPETDPKGARVIAERIREAVKARVFQTELGPLSVTLSLGVATLPADGGEKQALIELADQCLYHAKRNGRDRCVSVSQLSSAKRPPLERAG